MCYKAPGPRCSAHTKATLKKATAELKQANQDLGAVTADTSASPEKIFMAKSNLANAKMAYYKAMDEFDASPEGIKRNRENARKNLHGTGDHEYYERRVNEGVATRKRQMEAFQLHDALERQVELDATMSIAGMANHSAVSIISFAGKNASDVFNEAGTSDDKGMLHELARKNSFTDTYGNELQYHLPYSDLKTRILRNPNTAGPTLGLIVTEKEKNGTLDRESLRAIAKHPNASTEILEAAYSRAGRIEGGFETPVAFEAAKHPNSSEELLNRIAKDWGRSDNKEVANALLTNPRLSEAARADLLKLRKASILK